MKKDAVFCPALEGGAGCDGNGFAGGVADPYHDLQPK